MTILNLPFKWFTIEQAISEINNHLGYTLSKNDILHLAQNYNLALCVNVKEINDSFIDLYDQVTEIESYIMLEIEEREIYLSLLDEFTEEETLFFDLGNCQLQLFELRRNDLDDYRFLIADSYNFSGLLEIKKDEINYCGDILEVRADSLRDIEITYQEKKITGLISFLETEKDIEIPIDKAVITKESLLQFISENKKETFSENSHIEKLTEKEKIIKELQDELKSNNQPILLGKYRDDDLLKIAIEVRNKYWAAYPENVKSNAQIRDYIMRDYGVAKTTAEEIEKIACPINRKKN